LNAADAAIVQHNFYAVGVGRAPGQDTGDDPLGQGAGTLVVLFDDFNPQAGGELFSLR
jgi:hypothetical protein